MRVQFHSVTQRTSVHTYTHVCDDAHAHSTRTACICREPDMLNGFDEARGLTVAAAAVVVVAAAAVSAITGNDAIARRRAPMVGRASAGVIGVDAVDGVLADAAVAGLRLTGVPGVTTLDAAVIATI
jgi:hypothetical protein